MTISLLDRPWWRDGVVYQIYPASFKDSNGDGLGDIPGAITKLDYLKDLGIDIIWMSPMYKSPQFDMGYDISDYERVHEPYGTLSDMETLIQECHKRGMRLILDLVINHTSHLHSWFLESRSAKDNSKRDWYIWRPARHDEQGNRMPPNNWRSCFGGSVWTWDELTQEYYLHLFTPEQPDLNWENEETREAIYDSAMRFWLDKGVDGFRVDTVNMYSKPGDMPNAPVADTNSFDQPASSLFCNGPRMHEYLREMNDKVLNKYDTMTVGELPHTPDTAHVLRYIDARDKQLNMVFQFDMVDLGKGDGGSLQYTPFTLPQLKRIVAKWQTFIEGTQGWTTAFCENHDQGRSVSRFASDLPLYRDASAKMLAVLMTTMTGTLFLYQGQEIGMINYPLNWPVEELQDVASINHIRSIRERSGNDPVAMAKALADIQRLGRDNARTPMQWDGSANSGFCSENVRPWMRVHDLYPEINVQRQQKEKDSVLNFWKQMIRLRRKYGDLFIHGRFTLLDEAGENTFCYMKEGRSGKVMVVLNFSPENQPFQVPPSACRKTLLVGSLGVNDSDILGPFEGRVYLIS